jgi:hypothetical protein
MREAKVNLQHWDINLNQVSRFFYPHNSFCQMFMQLRIERKAGDAALLSMTQNVAARLDVKSKRSLFVLSLTLQGFLTPLHR